MSRFALAFLIVGFVAAFFGFAGVSTAPLEPARALFLVCLIGFVITVAYIASVSRHAPH